MLTGIYFGIVLAMAILLFFVGMPERDRGIRIINYVAQMLMLGLAMAALIVSLRY